MTRSSYALAAAMTLGGASGGVVMAQICGLFMSASWVVGAVVGGAWGIVTFAQLRLEDYLAEKRREWSDEAPRVEGDLDLDDGRPTDPGEELTVVSEPEWVEDTLVSAADELGRVTGPDRGGSS